MVSQSQQVSKDKRFVRLVFTVGLSLLENARKRKREEFLRLLSSGAESGQLASQLEKVEEMKLAALDQEVEDFLKQDPKSHDVSAEAYSFELLRKKQLKDRKQDELEVLLLGTQGDGGEEGSKVCAERLKNYMVRHWQLPESQIRCGSVVGGIKKENAFKRALLALVRELEDLLEKGDADETYVIITGGYKGFTPWLSLVTTLYDDAYVVYVHEDSTEPLIWPGLYLQWDLRRLDEIRSAVKLDQIDERQWEALPPSAQYLYDQLDHSTYRLNALGEMIQRFFEGNRLLRYGYGRPLLLKLKTKDSELYDIIMKCLPYWEHLWIGDQIPETVEHSRLHSLRIMEYAYWLLKFFPELEGALGGEGLFYLISALWLHDIGHGALGFKSQPISLMPSLVRETHNLTSAMIIRNDPDFQALPNEALLPSEHREPVGLLAEYNRRKQLLTEAQREALESQHPGQSFPEPLETKDSSLVLTGALLGLLDGLDVQIDRAVTDEYRQAREQRNRYEIETYLKWLQDWQSQVSLPSDFDSLKYSNLKTLYQRYQSGGGDEQFEADLKECTKASESLFQEAWYAMNLSRLQWSSLSNRILFKMTQPPHVAKHGAVELIYLNRGEDDVLQINILPAEVTQEGDLSRIENEIQEEVERALGVEAFRSLIPKVRLNRQRGNRMDEQWVEPRLEEGGEDAY